MTLGRPIALILLAGTLSTAGCDLLRTTRLGYFDGPRLDQVRQGEVVRVAVFDVTPDDGEGGPEIAVAGPAAIALASAALEQVVKLASSELQAHLEKVAALHEASYEGRLVLTGFTPGRIYDLHVVRYVQRSKGDASPQECMRAIYRIETVPIHRTDAKDDDETRLVAVTVRSLEGSDAYDEAAHLSRAAVRLDRADEPLDLETTLEFFTASATPIDEPTGEDANSGNADDDGDEGAVAKRVRLGDPMVHARKLRIDRRTIVPEMTLTGKPEKTTKIDGNEEQAQPAHMTPIATDALGFFLVDANANLLEIHVSVTERDPSRAAERNRQVKDNLASLTPQLVDFVKVQAKLDGDGE